MTDYNRQAQDFLRENGIAFEAKYADAKCPPWEAESCIHGDRYRITLRSAHVTGAGRARAIRFDFWNSYQDMQNGATPAAYDVLASISSDVNAPDSFEEWCSEYGDSEDSRRALATFRRCSAFAKRLRAFFTADEIEALQEIR